MPAKKKTSAKRTTAKKGNGKKDAKSIAKKMKSKADSEGCVFC